MKNMLLLLLLFTGIVNGQIINFPDANFKAKLLQPGAARDYAMMNYITIDANNNGEIEVSEVQSVWYLDVSNANISDLTGISYFTNISILNCNNNLLQNINIGNSTPFLKSLNCSNNVLQSLLIDPSVTLRYLKASNNQLSSALLNVQFDHTLDPLDPEFTTWIELSYNNLTTFAADGDDYEIIDCSHNPLTAFNLNGSFVKRYLNLSYTSLTSIEGSGRLKFGNFQNSQFTLLDLTNISFYSMYRGSRIYLGNNPVDKVIFGEFSPNNLTYSSTNTFFDIGNYRGFNNCNYYPDNEESGIIDIIDCPNLNFIGLKNGINYGNTNCFESASGETWTQSTLRLQITNSPNLAFICVDEGEKDHIQEKINALGLQNQVQVNSYCSFTPGGDFNTISGNILYDLTGNGCDISDTPNLYMKVNINDGTNSGSTFTNSTGNYTFYTQNGDFTVTPEVENPSYFNFSPPSSVLNFPVVDNSTQTQNFCMTANGVHPDVEIVIVPLDDAVPGSEPRYKIIYRNKGNQVLSGTYSVSFNGNFMTWVAAIPNEVLITPELLTWDYTNLNPFETRVGEFTMRIENVPIANPGVTFDYVATINPIPGDVTPLDNVSTFTQTVVANAGLNNITCIEGNTLSVDQVGEYLHYNVNFRNQSPNNATNVVVKCIIDPAKYDINSFQLEYASHEFITKVTGNVVEVIFNNINLVSAISNPIGGHGNVLFKIRTLPTLVVDDEVIITANIYFDYDSPISTNDARTDITALSKISFSEDKSTLISPNPAQNIVFVRSKNIIKSIEIYDVQGRLLQMSIESKTNTTLDISDKSNGIYFLKVTTEKGSSVEKLVKEN